MFALSLPLPWHSPIYITSYGAGKNKHVFVCIYSSGLQFQLIGWRPKGWQLCTSGWCLEKESLEKIHWSRQCIYRAVASSAGTSMQQSAQGQQYKTVWRAVNSRCHCFLRTWSERPQASFDLSRHLGVQGIPTRHQNLEALKIRGHLHIMTFVFLSWTRLLQWILTLHNPQPPWFYIAKLTSTHQWEPFY